MARSIQVSIWLVLILCLVLPIKAARAITISYEATDLSDTVVGEDLWQYTYTVSDHTFVQHTGFTIYFDIALYLNLDDLPPYVNDDWDPIGIQPDPNIPADGFYDALALVENPSLADGFTISFLWLDKESIPGAQFFEIYDANNLETIASGTTTPVPEPATLLLFGSGLAGLLGFRRCKPRKNKSE